MASYTGKLLRIDLSSRRIETQASSDYCGAYLGGRGMATKIYWDECSPTDSAFSPEVPLIIALGPLAGVPAIGGSRWGIFSKTPLRIPHSFSHGNLGGTFGAEVKYAGYDGIIITGKADSPVFISIEDDRVLINPAEDLWGGATVETMEILKARSGSKAKVLCPGPAGETRIPYATVFADGDASCSGGIGATMGAKNLKAIVLRGSNRQVHTHDPEEVRRIAREIRSFGRGNVKVWGLDFMASGPNVKKLPCAGCMASCLRVKYTAGNGKRGKYMCQSRVFYLPYALDYYGRENDVPFLANRLCDEYGIDTWKLQEIIDWLDRCRKEGLLPDARAGFALSKIGSLEFIEELLEAIVTGTGIGPLLATGPGKAAAELGSEFTALLDPVDPYDPRYCTVNALLFPFDTREPIQQLHEAGLALSQWSSWVQGVEDAHISSGVFREIAKRFWGSSRAGDLATLEGKAEAARRIQNRQLAKESLVVCDWMYPVIDNPAGGNHAGDPGFESRILTAATGIRYDEGSLNIIGERIFNLQRAVMLREGHRPAADDLLPGEWHTTPLTSHVADPRCMVPGPGGRPVSRIGSSLPLPEFKRARDEFYDIRGWDVSSGLQSRNLLASLGLQEVYGELANLGLAVEKARKLGLGRKALNWLHYRLHSLKDLRIARQPERPPAPQMDRDELLEHLEVERLKYTDPKIAHNFTGWNKVMQYHITDFSEDFYFAFDDGKPGWLDSSAVEGKPDITYRMDSLTLRAMAHGELTGLKAYQQGALRVSASFADMMKLQALNKLS